MIDDDFIPLDDREPTEVVRDGKEPLVRQFPIITTTVTDDGGEPVIETGPSQKIDISGQSIINQAKKVLDYHKFKQDQAKKIRDYNNKLLKDTAKTIKYVENMKNKKPNNSLLIAAKKTREKYRKMRRRQRQWLNDVDTINYVDDTSLNDVKENKNLLIAAKKLKNLYRKMRVSQREKANAENAQAVKLLQKLEEEEMNTEAVDLLWKLEQEDAVELLQDLEDEEQAVKLLQNLEDGDRKKSDIVAGKTRAKYKKLGLKNKAKTEKTMVQATNNAELEDFLRELEDEEAMIKATDNAELEDFLRQLDDVESRRDAVNLFKKLEGEAKKGKNASAKIPSKYKKTRQKNRKRDKLAMIAAANEAELEDQILRATDLAEEAALHKDAVYHLTKLEADAKKTKNGAAKTLAKYAKVRQKKKDEQAMIQAADDAELQDQMIRATDEAEDKYLQDKAVKALGKLEKEAKKKKVLAGKTRDKYKQIRKKRMSRVNKENTLLIKFLQKLEDEEENADAIELLQQLEDEDKVKQKFLQTEQKINIKKCTIKKRLEREGKMHKL